MPKLLRTLYMLQHTRIVHLKIIFSYLNIFKIKGITITLGCNLLITPYSFLSTNTIHNSHFKTELAFPSLSLEHPMATQIFHKRTKCLHIFSHNPSRSYTLLRSKHKNSAWVLWFYFCFNVWLLDYYTTTYTLNL